MTIVQKSSAVFLAEGPIAAVGPAEITTLKAAVQASPKRRARIKQRHERGQRVIDRAGLDRQRGDVHGSSLRGLPSMRREMDLAQKAGQPVSVGSKRGQGGDGQAAG